MTAERIKDYVDNRIRTLLNNGDDFDVIRAFLYKKSNEMKQRMITNHGLCLVLTDITEIGKLPTQLQWRCQYIYYAENRIIDLYKIELKNWKRNYSIHEKFNLLVFRERIQNELNSNQPF